MFIFVRISYKYTYLDVPVSNNFSFGDNAIYLESSLLSKINAFEIS